jgi:hypothetical protein
MDHDAGRAALDALADGLRAAGVDYAHAAAPAPNTGRPTGVDLDGDGRHWRARDAHGYGLFTGDGGMALLSRHPLGEVRDFSGLLWRDLPGSAADDVTPAEALDILRLHTVGAWDVEILTPEGPFRLLASHATAPVFDGPEDRNGLRNADEMRFWTLYLDGWAPQGESFGAEAFAVAGTFNVDPDRGEGRRDALRALLDHPSLQDPMPASPSGRTETADWDEPAPGDLRVDYILPAAGLRVTGSGVIWPRDGERVLGIASETADLASDHRLVWVDIAWPPAPP